MYVVGAVVERNGLVDAAALLPACAKGNAGGGALQCWYEAFVREAVLKPHQMLRSGAPQRAACAPRPPPPPPADCVSFRSAAAGFLPPRSVWPSTMPTWNDTLAGAPAGGPPYRRRVMQGQVSDGNAYALGGIAGHAGLFSTAADLGALLAALLQARHSGSGDGGDWAINGTTVRKFTTVVNRTQVCGPPVGRQDGCGGGGAPGAAAARQRGPAGRARN
eukprot:SAG11_NODE_599_length_8269_cov_3.455080_3_plen_219_part_00